MVTGDQITFGHDDWLVLDVKDNSALIITEVIIALRWYHNKFEAVTWADCSLRKFLNSEFFNRFSPEEKAGIIPVINKNPGNPWFIKTQEGKDTEDKIFLLSLEEVCRYFGDSSEKLQNKGNQRWHIDDKNNEKRQAKFGNDFHWWRLRSPGYYDRTSAGVSKDGYVYVRGNGVYGRPRDGGGVRPALWLRLNK